MQLYTVRSHFKDDGTKRDKTYYVDSKEDAEKKFFDDPNNRMYMEIDGIYPIEGNICSIDFQLGREIFDFQEYEYNILPGDGTNDYYIEVLNIQNLGIVHDRLLFAPSWVHSGLKKDVNGERYELSLMICIADGTPNWIYID